MGSEVDALFFSWIRDESGIKIRGGTDRKVGIFITGDEICTNGGVHCVMYKYIRETPDKHGARMPMHFESAWFLGGSAMKVEPKYWAVAITRWEYL